MSETRQIDAHGDVAAFFRDDAASYIPTSPESSYVVKLTYSQSFQTWPDVFGPFADYDAAKEFAADAQRYRVVTGFAIDVVRDPEFLILLKAHQ